MGLFRVCLVLGIQRQHYSTPSWRQAGQRTAVRKDTPPPVPHLGGALPTAVGGVTNGGGGVINGGW